MPVSLKFDIIKSMIEAGADTESGETVDPSFYPVLGEAGVALVTTYVEQLSLIGLVRDPQPVSGENGGMWIGFSLTESGRKLAGADRELRRAVAPLIGGPKTEVSEAVVELLTECREAGINEIYQEDFLKSLDQVRICFDSECSHLQAYVLLNRSIELNDFSCLYDTLRKNGLPQRFRDDGRLQDR